MKILFLSNLYPPFVRGGAEYLGAELVRELKRQGHMVSVLTTAPLQSLRSLATSVRDEGGVRVYRFRPLNLYWYGHAGRFPELLRVCWQLVNLVNLHTAAVLRRALKSEQPELVVSFNLMGLGFNLPRVIRRAGTRHVHVLHDVQLLHPSGLFLWGGRDGNSRAAQAYQALTLRSFAGVPVGVSPSRWLMEEHVRRRFFRNARQVVLPNPVPPFTKGSAVKQARAPLELLYVGQFAEHKGLPWLLGVLHFTLEQNFRLHLAPAGAAEGLTEVREQVRGDKRFVVHDLMSQAELDALYEASHLTLVPSLCYENAPTAITKSLSAGTPVLAANLGGIPELVQEGETGWLFEPGNAEDFRAKLNWCVHHPAKLLAAGLTASRAFESRTLAAYARDIVELAG